jgi:hypothetical protein
MESLLDKQTIEFKESSKQLKSSMTKKDLILLGIILTVFIIFCSILCGIGWIIYNNFFEFIIFSCFMIIGLYIWDHFNKYYIDK